MILPGGLVKRQLEAAQTVTSARTMLDVLVVGVECDPPEAAAQIFVNALLTGQENQFATAPARFGDNGAPNLRTLDAHLRRVPLRLLAGTNITVQILPAAPAARLTYVVRPLAAPLRTRREVASEARDVEALREEMRDEIAALKAEVAALHDALQEMAALLESVGPRGRGAWDVRADRRDASAATTTVEVDTPEHGGGET